MTIWWHQSLMVIISLLLLLFMMMIIVILGKMTWLFHEVATGADVLVELANQLLHPHLCKRNQI